MAGPARKAEIATTHPRAKRGGAAVLALAPLFFFVGLGCEGDRKALLRDADAYRSAGRFELEIEALRRILDDDPNHPEANLRLGEALLETQEPSLAVWPLARALAATFHSATAGSLLAKTLVELEDYAAALRILDGLRSQHGDSAGRLLLRSRALLGLRRGVEAIEVIERARALAPESVEAVELHGMALMRLGRVDEARALWNGLFEASLANGVPDRAKRACVALARLYESEAENEAAARMHDTCLSRLGVDATLAREASDFHLRSGNPERAIEILRIAAQADPGDLVLSARLATQLLRVGRIVEARTQLESSAESVDTAEAWRILGDFQRSVGANDAALDTWQRALDRNPIPRDPVLFALADLHLHEKRLERASALRDELSDPALRRLIDGAIAWRQSDPRRALEELEAGLIAWPHNAGARDLAGQAALALGEPDRAVAHWREAVRVAPGTTDAARRLAQIHASRSEPGPALDFARRHSTTRPYDGDPSALLIGIRAAIELERLEDAQTLVDMLDQAAPGTASADLARLELRLARDSR